MSSTRIAQCSAGVPSASGALTSTFCARRARIAAASRLAAAVASRVSAFAAVVSTDGFWAERVAPAASTTSTTPIRRRACLIRNAGLFYLRSRASAVSPGAESTYNLSVIFSSLRPPTADTGTEEQSWLSPEGGRFCRFQEDSYEQVYPEARRIRSTWRGSRRAASGAG